jgi:hypothetical protein
MQKNWATVGPSDTQRTAIGFPQWHVKEVMGATRGVIAELGGTATAWLVMARAHQPAPHIILAPVI